MLAKRFSLRVALLGSATALFLSACSNYPGTSSIAPQTQQAPSSVHTLSPHKKNTALEGAAAPKSSGASQCTSIDTLNPNSDFVGHGFTTAAYNGGNNLNINATGCTYGIYLYPGARNLHISRAKVNGAYRVQIFAEQVPGVTIDHTTVNTAGGSSLGGIAFRGASGTVSNASIYNTTTFGLNIVANNACFGSPGTCMEPNVSVTYTTIDNSKSTGDGVVVIGAAVPPATTATASISHTMVIGANLAIPPGVSAVDIYGAQTGFAIFDGDANATYDQSINDQVGFDAYCSAGFTNSANLNRVQHNKVSYRTPVSLTGVPGLAENQVLNAFSQAQIDAAFGPGSC